MRAFLIATALFASSAFAQTPEEATKKSMEQLKKSAEREARSTSKVGCAELLAETSRALSDTYTRNLDVDTFRMTMALEMSAKQAKGTLFATGDAGKDKQAADAACRVHLHSLERARKKSDAAMTELSAAPPACVELAGELDTGCFAPFKQTGVFSDACGQIFRLQMSTRSTMLRKLAEKDGTAPSPEERCKTHLTVYRKMVENPRPAPAPGKK